MEQYLFSSIEGKLVVRFHQQPAYARAKECAPPDLPDFFGPLVT
jgi:hypothetical protein